ncbi:MAG: hypothetical protein ACPG6V_07565 [Flavobacteriales bacterium]
MKKNLFTAIALLSSILSFSSFAQLTTTTFPADKWPGICENINLEYTIEATTNANVYNMQVDIKNIGTTDIEVYCDVYESLTANAVVSAGGNCYPKLMPNEVKPINFTVDISAEPTLESFELLFKVKNGKDDQEYCQDNNRFWLGSALNINEIDRTDMAFEVEYFDLLGRNLEMMPVSGLFIQKKTYEDGFQTVEKIYLEN